MAGSENGDTRMMWKVGVAVAAAFVMVVAFGTGVASADHGGGTEWTCNVENEGPLVPCPGGERNLIGPATDNAYAPIGSHLSTDETVGSNHGRVNGIQNPMSNAAVAVANNPLCPFHDVEVVGP